MRANGRAIECVQRRHTCSLREDEQRLEHKNGDRRSRQLSLFRLSAISDGDSNRKVLCTREKSRALERPTKMAAVVENA